MLLVDKDSNVLADKKEAVVTAPLLEKKLLTTEKVTTSDQVHKRNENITTSEEVVKGTYEVHKFTKKITTNEGVDKGSEKLENMKEAVVTIRRKDSDKFEGRSKGSTGQVNIDHEFLKRKLSKLEPYFYKNFTKRILEVQTWNRIKRFFVPFYSTKLKLLNRNDTVKDREKNIASDDEGAPNNSESSSDKKK